MTQEALKLALEALTIQSDRVTEIGKQREAITAIKEALRENAMREVQRLGQEIEQEPEYAWPTVADYERDVGFQTNEAFRMAWGMARTTNKMLGHPSPPQRTWVGLTDEEIDTWNIVGHESLREFVRAIEAKLKEKNT